MRRLPSPPARTMARTLAAMALTLTSVEDPRHRSTKVRTVAMRIDLLTREYPPDVYGGAGVHVEYLARDLRRLDEVQVRCFGAMREDYGVHAYRVPGGLETANAALQVMGVDLEMAAG